MNRKFLLAPAIMLAVLLTGCGSKPQADPAAEAPPPPRVEHEGDISLVKVEHPEQFPLTTASGRDTTSELNVTGVVTADVSRTIPVISLASGRVVEIYARLGDVVRKGQLLLKVQSADISAAYSDYQQAQADETLSKAQYERSQILYDKGAIAQKDLEVAKDTDEKAKVTVATTRERLRILGADPQHPSAIIDIHAPVSGVITDQQVTTAAGVQGLSSANPFTISDLSSVWILCDVYENDLAQVQVGEYADIRLNAYPDRVLKARIGVINPVLDPNLRTAKVRLEVRNPGIIRLGMFVKATFHGQQKQTRAVVPATAVLHLHDHDFIYTPEGPGQFRRLEVSGGAMLDGKLQELLSGLEPGRQVVKNALVLQNTVEQ